MNDPSLQKPDHVDLDDFRMPAAALAKARAEDVPTYCPTLFGDVLALWNQAQNEAASRGSASQVREQLEEAMEKLGQASKQAASSRDALSDLVHLRTESQRNLWERYYAPEILMEAERYYWLAIREAENGKLGEAGKHAATARKLFWDATLQSLKRGPIAHLENQVIEAEQTVPQGRLQDAGRELADLREMLAKARQGDLTVSALRTRIRVGREAVRSLLTLTPNLNSNGGVPDSDFGTGGWLDTGWTFSPPDPPVTMRIGERTENSLTVWWLNQSSTSEGPLYIPPGNVNKLLRQKDDGPWEVIAEFGQLSGWTTYTDPALPSTNSPGFNGLQIGPLFRKNCSRTPAIAISCAPKTTTGAELHRLTIAPAVIREMGTT